MFLNFIKNLVQIITDSLFPISNADKLLFSYTPNQALKRLPKALRTPISDTYAVFAYKNTLVTRLVWNIKYKKNIKAVEIGGYALYERVVIETINKKPILLIPIPITQKRRNERGFNQCELLIDEMLRLDGTNNKLITSKNLLVRIVHKDRQTLKDRKQRLVEAKGIFSVNKEVLDLLEKNYFRPDKDLCENTSTSNNKPVKNMLTIVIDDVITTGSTMKEAMETLKNAGFSRVIGISLAH